MKNIFLTIFTTVGTLLLAVFLIWNFVPFSWLDYLTFPQEREYGVALTVINSTDKISSLPTTLNANFNALNAGSVDVATTSMESLASTTNLVAVGTLTTGTWNASTLTVSYGGTGSTTLAIGQILLGSSTNAVSMVDGFGTTGQFLTSNGADTKPTWQTSAVDQTLAYQWTGIHNFTTTALFTNFNASSTLILGGTSWTFPVADNASGTPLRTNGSGSLTFSSLANASSTVFTASGTWVRPAGVNSVIVTVVGGGGGGGYSKNAGTPSAGGGGGGGGYVYGTVPVSGNVTVTVGTGGAGGLQAGPTNAGDGVASSFAGDVTITANGGTKGVSSNNNGILGGGAGGGTTVANGVIGISGHTGASGKAWAADSIGGAGGDSVLGHGGEYSAGSTASTGFVGTGCGGGGGGAGTDGSGNVDGGAGADGCVIVEWFID